MSLARRSVLFGLGALSCSRSAMTPARLTHRPAGSLPATTLPWLSLRDHFVATVGPAAGQGAPLGPLLVLADATFAPRSRFPLHPHREMEILSVVLDGDLSHHGDGAHGTVIRARGAQLISSRDGMVHAEGNDTDRPTRMLQIWIEPTSHGGAPAYFYRQLPSSPGLHLVAGDEGMPLRSPTRVWWLDVEGERTLEGRRGYVVGLSGEVQIAGRSLTAGDGAELSAGRFSVQGQGALLWLEV